MNIFNNLIEEQKLIEQKLEDTIENYGVWTREEVFDKVKKLCDALVAHLNRQKNLLLHHMTDNPSVRDELQEAAEERAILIEEIGQLVMVHVDEPDYTECLRNLLDKLRRHNQFSANMYWSISQHASAAELAKVKSSFEDDSLKIAAPTPLQNQSSPTAT